MFYDEITHHGVLGMKWGVRRYQNKDGSLKPAGKKRNTDQEEKKKLVKTMSDDELKKKISRLELEKRYKDLNPTSEKSDRGKKFVMDVLERSGQNIATQLVTYGLGAAVNKAFGTELVNPKKGQKDK